MLRIKGATLITMDPNRRILPSTDLWIDGDQIRHIGPWDVPADTVVDARGLVAIPGLVQTHVHLCQTLFRGLADDLELLDWLEQRIWPLEGAHDPESVYYSALVGIAELLRGGTTTILDMETVHHTGEAFRALRDSGIRAFAGKCMMDAGDGVPDSLQETTADSLAEALDLYDTWHNAGGGRLRYAFSPRFVLSCSDPLLREVGTLARARDALIHTHAAENVHELAAVVASRGRRNLEHLDYLGLTGPRLVLAHGIWLDRGELDRVAATGTKLVHCPSSNLKLGSGIAPTTEWLARHISFGLGADGAPCNNLLDMFVEMRTAALIQKPIHGPRAFPAAAVFEQATLGGARVLGLEHAIGSLEPGKQADIVLLDWSGPHHQPHGYGDPYGRLVYQTLGRDVVATWVAGRLLYHRGRLLTIDEPRVYAAARKAITRLVERSGLPLDPGPLAALLPLEN